MYTYYPPLRLWLDPITVYMITRRFGLFSTITPMPGILVQYRGVNFLHPRRRDGKNMTLKTAFCCCWDTHQVFVSIIVLVGVDFWSTRWRYRKVLPVAPSAGTTLKVEVPDKKKT